MSNIISNKEYKKNGHNCIDCGKRIYRKSDRCASCATIFAWEKPNRKPIPKGPEHKNFKGNPRHSAPRKQNRDYIRIYMPEHRRAQANGTVYEHIIKWEEYHNKKLPEGWIVHHLNGIKSDNRIINLAALPNKKHCHVLAAKGKRIQELEALLMGQSQLL